MKKQIVMLVVGLLSSMSAFAQPEQGIGEPCSVLATLVSADDGCNAIEQLNISPQVGVFAGTTYQFIVEVLDSRNELVTFDITPEGYYATRSETWLIDAPVHYRVNGSGNIQVNFRVLDFYTKGQVCAAQQLVIN